MFNPLESRVSYVSSCINSLGARVPCHVSYVDLLIAGVYITCLMHQYSGGWIITDHYNFAYFIIHLALRASESSVSRITYQYINFMVVLGSHVY